MFSVLWKAITEDGKLSKGPYDGDAGLDLSVAEDTAIMPYQFKEVPCGIQIALPHGTAALVIARSSTVRTYHLLVYPTLIEQYRGDLFVFCYNLTKDIVSIPSGSRIAQLLLVPVLPSTVSQVTALPESERGTNGFGSSGR